MLKLARRESINLKRNKVSELGKDREWGTGSYRRGIEMASKLNESLMMCYISPFMQQIVPVFLETQKIWLFDDQVIVKLPNEDYTIPGHYDNQYGPDPEGALNGDYQIINFMWVLTNSSKESGALEIKNNKTGEWDLIESKASDIIAIDGNTLYRSSRNTSNKSNAIYACIFSNKQLIFKGFYEMKWRFCNCRDGLKNHKLHEEDQELWQKHSKK